MLITKITRTYSRSINLKDYGLPESWVKIEATFEAHVNEDEQSNVAEIAKMIHNMVFLEVLNSVNALITKATKKTAAPSSPPYGGIVGAAPKKL